MRWYSKMGRRVWFHEVLEFIFNGGRLKDGPTLREFMGASLAEREYALDKAQPAKSAAIWLGDSRRNEKPVQIPT